MIPVPIIASVIGAIVGALVGWIGNYQFQYRMYRRLRSVDELKDRLYVLLRVVQVLDRGRGNRTRAAQSGSGTRSGAAHRHSRVCRDRTSEQENEACAGRHGQLTIGLKVAQIASPPPLPDIVLSCTVVDDRVRLTSLVDDLEAYQNSLN